jgi:putative ABC transport system permease protein
VSVLGIALKSLRQRALSSALTAASVALGVALTVLVVTARESSSRAFHHAARGYDVILGGVHTSPLTSVMSTVFHVDRPLDTVPIASYLAIRKDDRVRYAVPYALGDVFRGFRVVGTTPDLFKALFDAEGKPLEQRIKPRVFEGGPDEKFEAVLGAVVAAESGLQAGDDLTGITHGFEDDGHEHTDVWKIVGVMEPTGTPSDRVVFIQLESFFHLKGHEAPPDVGHEGEATDPWAVSAIVVRLKSPGLRPSFIRDVRKDATLQAADPFVEINRLFSIVEDVDALFRAVAIVVVAVSAIAILVGLYNAVAGRRREIAILRALGARRAHVFAVVTIEAVVLCVAGGVAGLLLGHGALAAAAPMLVERFGVRVSAAPTAFDLQVLAGLVVMGLVVGLLPAWRAFRVEVARHLHPVD